MTVPRQTGSAMPRTEVALLPLIVLILGLAAYSLVRLLRAEPPAYLPKWAWALLIVLVIPWGAIAYLLLARPSGPTNRQSAPAPAPAPVAATTTNAPTPAVITGPPAVTTSGL